MNIDHTQRVAIVTGGSRGIGRAVAERLAAEGMAVVVAYVSNDREAMETVNTIHAKGGAALAFRADVADEQAVAALFDISEQTFGGVDVVVNAAGIMLLSPLAELDLAQLDRMLRTNVRGTFVVAQQAVRRVRKGGAIITFSTSVTKVALPTYGAYAATKGAVDALSLIAARELRGALRLLTPSSAHWQPPVLACSARTGAGLDDVWAAVQRHRATLEEHGELAQKRADQQVEWMWAMVRDQLMDRLRTDPRVRAAIPELESGVRAGQQTPTLAAQEILGLLGMADPAS